jgi:ankyrin repeat protein
LLLIDNGTAVDVKNIDDRTALHFAAKGGNECFLKDEVVKVLLEKGADVDAEDKFGNTAVSYAVERGRVSVVKILKDAAVAKCPLSRTKYLLAKAAKALSLW